MTKVLDNGQVEFRFFKPDASQVRIAGDFCDWKPIVLMSPETDAGARGWWSVRIAMSPGKHLFRYEVDGRWFTDFASHGLEPCLLGLINSVLTVPVYKVAR